MDKFQISVIRDKETIDFEVLDYLHHEGERCKFEIFKNGEFIAGFEPDSHEYLRICKNPGMVEEELLYLIADKLEAHYL